MILEPDAWNVPQSEDPVGVDLWGVMHRDSQVGHRLRHERVTDEREEDREPVPYEAAAPIRVKRESQDREKQCAGGDHPTFVHRANGRDKREHESDYGEASPQPHRPGLVRRRARVQKHSQLVQQPQQELDRREGEAKGDGGVHLLPTIGGQITRLNP